METFVATLVIFAAVLSAMALGVIVQGRPLKGSCGGVGGDCTCTALAARSCAIRREREARARAS